jgi:hypothetical protein
MQIPLRPLLHALAQQPHRDRCVDPIRHGLDPQLPTEELHAEPFLLAGRISGEKFEGLRQHLRVILRLRPVVHGGHPVPPCARIFTLGF